MRWRALTWAAGVGTLAVTLAGAARLLDAPPASVPPPPAGLVGTTAHGEVTSEPPPVRVGPPAVAGQFPVERVFVSDGKAVKAGDPLVQFDDRALKAKLQQAEGNHAGAVAQVEEARQAVKGHAARVKLQLQAIKAARDLEKNAQEARRRGGEVLERMMATQNNLRTNQPYTEADKVAERRGDNGLFDADAALTAIRHQVEAEELKLAVLEATPVGVKVQAAEAAVAAAAGLVAEAQAAVDACLVKAKLDGVVELLDAAPGMTFGPASNKPLLLLVPAGPRVVRAEVDPEFAYRVADKAGAAVTVTDFTNTALTYAGTVREVGKTFLPKRTAAGPLALDPPKVLECVIDLPDPAPAGKPPLRVNQPVRVIFPH